MRRQSALAVGVLLAVCVSASACAASHPVGAPADLVVLHRAGVKVTIAFSVTPNHPASCPSNLASRLKHKAGHTQLLFVVVAASRDTSASFSTFQLQGSCWRQKSGPWTARVGYNGINGDKHEGDGTTPAGIYTFLSTMYGNAASPGVHYSYHHFVCGDWWDEDSSSPQYNEFVHVPCSDTNPPFNNGASERLWQETTAYPSLAVLNYNAKRIPGKGSAIFLHADIGEATDGCVTLPLSQLDQVLKWMEPGDSPAIVIGTTGAISTY
jgi:L,D-peptidoglycan transpeptidase YkuD (ErfK/YbiS/YcfS/YnhG family)